MANLPAPVIPSDTVLDNSHEGWRLFQAFTDATVQKENKRVREYEEQQQKDRLVATEYLFSQDAKSCR